MRSHNIFLLTGFLSFVPIKTLAMSLELHGFTDTLRPEDAKYSDSLRIAGEVFTEVEDIFLNPEYADKTGWKKDEYNNNGDTVYAKKTDKGKMVTISTTLDCPVDFVMKETWNGVDALPSWNKNINFARVVAQPTEHFDLITYGNNDVLIVSGRYFVSARIYRKTHEGYIMASRSVDLSGMEMEGKVKAELVLAGARFRADPEDRQRTLVDVVMLADLKGMLPRFVVNQVLGKIMLLDTVANREHFAKLKKSHSQDGLNK